MMTTYNSVLACGVVDNAYSKGVISTVKYLSGGSIHLGKGVVTNIGTTVLSGDPRVIAFKQGNANRALVISYTYGPWGEPGNAIYGIYDPSNWSLLAQVTQSSWHNISNPYGIVTMGQYMYIADYDTAKVIKVDMNNDYKAETAVYSFVAPTGYNPHANGLDVCNGNLVAIFNCPDSSYNYVDSAIVVLDAADLSEVGQKALNKNAISVTVKDKFAYVCSMGGMQVGGGNSTAQLQVVNLKNPEVIPTPVNIATDKTPWDKGDFVDMAFVGTAAYVLLANYDTMYSKYDYQVIKTDEETLQVGNLTGTHTASATTSPAGATWLLALDGDMLWFVGATKVNRIDTAQADVAEAITTLTDAEEMGVTGINANLNTASVVIEGTSTTAKGVKAVSHARSKVAIRLLRPEELQKRQ